MNIYQAGKRGNHRLILQYLERLVVISEYGIFHGITNYQENKALKIKDKRGLFTIEWE
jgi:hypothetical protein